MTWFLLSGTDSFGTGRFLGGLLRTSTGTLLLLTPARFPTAHCVCLLAGEGRRVL